ncbi:MAG: DEAD/DEAH box helicase, partial [Candidatus Eisenbacteria bacterium]|nr:DEAD/DEAH box helicase [Candidatus Eisenbacteria bacterium]
MSEASSHSVRHPDASSDTTSLAAFHPAIRTWFERRFGAPTAAQAQAWPAIRTGRDTLLAAPTGSGKTLAAFLCAIDALLRESLDGPLPDIVRVIYVSPLKALSSDIQRNLAGPLEEVRQVARELGSELPPIRTALRTGDTPAAARREIVQTPPHILITTPESLYLMLTAARSREILRSARTLIVDEIHALLRDKRGSHLALSLARLDHVCERRPVRVGLSATQRPLERSARFLIGTGLPLDVASDGESPTGSAAGEPVDCTIVDVGHQRDLDLALELPRTELEAVCSHDQWADIYDRLVELIGTHRTTLIFVNTRRLAERIAHQLRERLGEEHVGSHHGSLAKERRLRLEQRLKAGEMKALVATASLELGIDIGSVDLVCQIESPRSVATFLQRVGRSGHALGLVPKGRLFPTTRDELVECVALLRAIRGGRLDALRPPIAPLDVLAQQIVAECACEDWGEDDLFALFHRAAPYAALSRRDYDSIVEMLSEGIPSGIGRIAHYLHRDGIHRKLHGRRNARHAAIEGGGAIPENADYQVIAEPDGAVVGTLNEDFAIESAAGDIFLLGTTSWRIRKVERGIVRVEDARGAPPTLPFWLGEAPGRTLELSDEVSALRRSVAERLAGGRESALTWLSAEAEGNEDAAQQILAYLEAQLGALGVLPTRCDVVYERFFDESGGMQLVVHAPFGGSINRAWGLGLRKKFCKTFDFELQAAATDDAILLSMGPQNSFPLEDIFRFLSSATIVETMERAALTSPFWNTRWRWNATRALAVPRQKFGKKVPPPIQRMRADDLLAAVFPQQVACQENATGPIEAPEHPLVDQTLHDCLYEAMDTEGLRHVLEEIEAGRIRLHARDTTEPSPFTHEILNSKPYAYLDDAPLEERRARAITLRRTLPENARDLGTLDPEAIARVQEEIRPDPRNAEEVHEWLLGLGVLRADTSPDWQPWVDELVAQGRLGILSVRETHLWTAAESIAAVGRIFPDARWVYRPDLPEAMTAAVSDSGRATADAVRGHLDVLGPVSVAELSHRLQLSRGTIQSALAALEAQGTVLRGRFRAEIPGVTDGDVEEFCDRRLLARIHRYTLDRLRREIEPQTVQEYLRFLIKWQHVSEVARLEGKRGLLEAIGQLQGFEAPAMAWERELLPARVKDYDPEWLDELCLSGAVTWLRPSLRSAHVERDGSDGDRPVKATAPANVATPISLVLRRDLTWLLEGVRGGQIADDPP